MAPNFNPQIAKFLAKEPPPVNTKVVVPIQPTDPLDINTFLDGGEFYEYSGSMTAPPCAEIVTWMVRTKPILASDLQIAYLVDGTFRMNSFFGNYREVMPINGRQIALRTAIRESPPPADDGVRLPDSTAVKTDREYRAMKWAKDALKIAKGSVDYVKDLDTRIRNSAMAHTSILDPTAFAGPPTAPPAGLGTSPDDMARTAELMSQSIAEAARDAVQQASWQIQATAKEAAMDAAKKAADMVSVGSYPGGGALPVTPPPTMAPMPGMPPR